MSDRIKFTPSAAWAWSRLCLLERAQLFDRMRRLIFLAASAKGPPTERFCRIIRVPGIDADALITVRPNLETGQDEIIVTDILT